MLTSTDPWDYVHQAVAYLCDRLAAGLTDDQVRTLLHDPGYQSAEDALEAAADRADLAAVQACAHRWWLAALQVLIPMAVTDATLAHRKAAWERVYATLSDVPSAHQEQR